MRIPDKDEVHSSILCSPTSCTEALAGLVAFFCVDVGFAFTESSSLHSTANSMFGAVGTLRRMKMLRRALVALSFAGTIAGVLRLRGKGGVPPQEGGWREVSVPPK